MSRVWYSFSHFSLSQKGTLSYTKKKCVLLYKNGVFYWASKSPISLEKGVFFRPKSAKRRCFSNLGTSMVYALVGSGAPGIICQDKHLHFPWSSNKLWWFDVEAMAFAWCQARSVVYRSNIMNIGMQHTCVIIPRVYFKYKNIFELFSSAGPL